MTFYVDNTGAINLAENWSTSGRTKHIDVRFHYLREMNEQGMVEIKFVKSEWNVSDIFTKNLSEKLFCHHTETLGIFTRDKEGVSMKESAVSRMNGNLQNCAGGHTTGNAQKTKERRTET